MRDKRFVAAHRGGPLALAQHAGHGAGAADAIPHHDSPYSHLFDPKIRDLPAAAAEVRSTASSAPAAARQGRWVARANRWAAAARCSARAKLRAY